MRKLLIISSSSRMLKEPKDPIPAIRRYDGILIRSIRNYVNKLKNVDVLILSPVYGLISPEKEIPHHESIGGSWHKAQFPEDKIDTAKEANLLALKELLSKRKYDEIYINIGKTMLRLIEGFEQIVPKRTKITYAEGTGIGPKVAHMKNWMELQLHS
jgi:hypothetical protein